MKNQTSAERVDGLLHDLLIASGLSLTYEVSLDSPDSKPCLTIRFDGPDAGMLTADDCELLFALEHVAARSLRLDPEEQDQIKFEAHRAGKFPPVALGKAQAAGGALAGR